MSRWNPNYAAPAAQDFREGDPALFFSQFNSNWTQPNRSAPQTSQVYYRGAQNAQANSGDTFRSQANPYSNNSFRNVDISNSNLQPTATEFRPSSSLQSSSSSGSNTGAVKREYSKYGKQNKSNKQPLESSRGGRYARSAPNRTQEQMEAIKETANGLKAMQVKDDGSSSAARNNKPKYGKNNSYGNRNGYYNNYNQGDGFYKKINSNWRQSKPDYKKEQNGQRNFQSSERNAKSEKPQQFQKKLDAASQRERLEQMVSHRQLECLVCCERVHSSDAIWSCKQCYHILHLNCVIRWANSSTKPEEGWRCPACQFVYVAVPKEYRCYCGKRTEPTKEAATLAHSCGELCARKRAGCPHPCTLLCHPGPCPDCSAMVARACGCGRTAPTVKCSSDLRIECHAECGKMLECGAHVCRRTCHGQECGDCDQFVIQECHCGKQGRKVLCTENTRDVTSYQCDDVCGKLLPCGNHTCDKPCHAGCCGTCALDPAAVNSCPCGKTALNQQRETCLDPILCCDKICNKKLKCGQPSDPHECQQSCHTGECAPCPQSSLVRCRCGHMDREIACKELTTKADDARCQKKCTKKRLCSKHKCNQLCCIEVEHVCPLLCNRLLSCGLHKCEENCHRGNCPPCWRTSFEELYCECGASVMYPPVACGTRPPNCTKPCSRMRPCGHEPLHQCHIGACPPCTVFTNRLCHGEHELRATIACHMEDFSCGRPCGRAISCGRHKCVQACHRGPCPAPCTQPCAAPRPGCEHACGQPCHGAAPCAPAACRQTVQVTCQCGLRTSTRSCIDLSADYQKLIAAQLAAKMLEVQDGQAVDIADFVDKQKKASVHKTLECNDECHLVERNRRLAIGLQIRNPDLSSKLAPRYSDFMRGWAKKDPVFCRSVHDKLSELVHLAKQSKQKSRSHSFDCMKKDKRHFVHEYCEHFGCDSAAYDKEPNRNIVATAYKEKSWLPSMSLLEAVQRESGQRKVPGPVLNKPDGAIRSLSASKPNESVSTRLQSRILPRPVTPPGEYVDYFDNPP